MDVEEEGFNWIFNGVIIFSSYFLRASVLYECLCTYMHHQCKLTCLIGKLMLFLFLRNRNGKLIISFGCVCLNSFIFRKPLLSVFLITIKKFLCRFLLLFLVTHIHMGGRHKYLQKKKEFILFKYSFVFLY